jgi:hypothetical protein
VDAVLALTRTTKATYSVCTWNVVTPTQEVHIEEWAAEFHKGVLHRVETPRDRIVANCATGKALYLSLITGEVSTSPSLAGVACGINANRVFTAKHMIARETRGAYGPVTRIELDDALNRRTYDVLDDGAIVAATTRDNDDTGVERVTSKTLSYSRSVPAEDLFSPESLKRSAVPETCRTGARS